MSGIAGLMHRDGRLASVDALAAMSAAVAHRGRDASGMACDGVVGLAHRMTWSTHESLNERQPLVRDTPSLRLVADARIDNRTELIAALGMNGAARVTDVDLIAGAYARWGTSCVEHLVGDFAFALWDGERRQLFCARDPMGVKPFYFFRSERLFAFASEAKALFALPDVPQDIDPIQIGLFVEGTGEDRRRTHYKAIQRLPAAHTMTVGPSRLEENKYWEPDAKREIRFSTSQQYAESFREIFEESVRARLRSVHPVGAALSGGLDSSSIVCMARKLQRDARAPGLHTFSLVFPSLPAKDLRMIDERRYIESVVRDGDLVPTYLSADRLSPLEDVTPILEALGEPYAAPNLYLHWSMYRASAERGVRVFLDGFDGDSAISHGFARLNGLVQRGEWAVFENEVRAIAGRRQVSPEFVLTHFGLPYLAVLARRGAWLAWARAARELSQRFGLPVGRTLWESGVRPATPEVIRLGVRALRRRQPEVTSLVRREIAATLRREGYAVERDEDLDIAMSERESHTRGIMQPAYQLTLEMASHCAASFGVEPRYPFFDRRLIDYCLALPEEEKLADGWPRLVFRRAMEGILPPEVRWRSDKGNLSPNFHRTLRASSATAADSAPDSPIAEYVDLKALARMRQRYCAETSTLGRSADGHLLFRVMVLEKWLSERTATVQGAESPVAEPAPVAA